MPSSLMAACPIGPIMQGNPIYVIDETSRPFEACPETCPVEAVVPLDEIADPDARVA